jgi:cation/acetate symporter
MAIVFVYAVLGGMKGITYTQVAQYCVMIFAYMIPAIYISIMMTGNPIPQIGFGSTVSGSDVYLLDKLNGLSQELGFSQYTSGTKSTVDVFFITVALMVGTAGLPHVIVRFFTVPKVSDARLSAGYALLFIAILYTTAPAVASFARVNLIETVSNAEYQKLPTWFANWEKSGLIAWQDKNGDGKIQYVAGAPFNGAPAFAEGDVRGNSGERVVTNESTANGNELYVDRDIMVLANPEIAQLPGWVIALIAAAGRSTINGRWFVVSYLNVYFP